MAQNKLDFTQEDIIAGVTEDMNLVETAARRLAAFSRMQYEREKGGSEKISSNQFYARLNNVVRQTIEERGVELVPDDGVRLIDSPVNTFSNICSYVTAYYMIEMKDERQALPKEAQDSMELFTSAHPVQLNLDDMFDKMTKNLSKLYKQEGSDAFSNPDTFVTPDFYIPPLDIVNSNGESERCCNFMHFYAPELPLADMDNFALGPTVALIANETIKNIEDMETPGFTFIYEKTMDAYGRERYDRVGDVTIKACSNKLVADMGKEHRRIYDELVNCVKAYEVADSETKSKMRNNAGPYKFREDYFKKNPNGSLYELSLIELQKVVDEKSFGVRDNRFGNDDSRFDGIKYNQDFNVYYIEEPAQFIDVDAFRDNIRQQLQESGFNEVKLPQLGKTVNPGKFLPEYDSVRTEIVSRLSDIKGNAFECSCDLAKGVDIRNEIAAHMPEIVVNGETYRIPLEDTLVNVYKTQYDAANKKNVAVSKVSVSEYIEHPEKYPHARVMFVSNVSPSKIDELTSRVLADVYSPSNIEEGKVALRDNPYDFVSGKVTYENLSPLYDSPRFIADEDALERVGIEVESLSSVREELVVDVANIQKEIYSKIIANETAEDAFNDETRIVFNGVDFGTVKDMMIKYHEFKEKDRNYYYHEGSGYQETAAKMTKEVVRKLGKSEAKNDNLKPIIKGQVDEKYKEVRKINLMPVYDQIREVVRDCREHPEKYENASILARNNWSKPVPGKKAVVGVEGVDFEVNIPIEYEDPAKEELVVGKMLRAYGEKYVKEYGFQANWSEVWNQAPKFDNDLMFSDKWRKGVEGTVVMQTGVGRDANGNATMIYTSIKMPSGKVFYPNMERFPENFGYNPAFFARRRGGNEFVPIAVSPVQAYAVHEDKGVSYSQMGLRYELVAATDGINGFVRDADGVIDIQASNEFRKNMGVVRNDQGKVDVIASNKLRREKGWTVFPTLNNKPLYDITDIDLVKYAPLEMLNDDFKEEVPVDGQIKLKSEAQIRREAFYREAHIAEEESQKMGTDFVNLIDETFRAEQAERSERESSDIRDVNNDKEYAGGARSDDDMYVYIPRETAEIREALFNREIVDNKINPIFKEATPYPYKEISGARVSLKSHFVKDSEGHYHVSPEDRASLLFSVIAERYPKVLDTMLVPDNPAQEKKYLQKQSIPVNAVIAVMQPGIKAVGDFYSAFDDEAFTKKRMASGWIICNRDSLVDAALGEQLRIMAGRYYIMETTGVKADTVNKMLDSKIASNEIMKYFNSLSTSEVLDVVASQAERLHCYEIAGAQGIKELKGVKMASPSHVQAIADLMDKGQVFNNHMLRFNADELRQQVEGSKTSKYAIKLTQSEAFRIIEGSLALRGISDKLSYDVVRSVKNIYAAVELKNNPSDKRWDNKVMDVLKYRVDETAITSAQKAFLKFYAHERDLNVLNQEAADEVIKEVKAKNAASVESNKKKLASVDQMKLIVNGGIKINNFNSYTKAEFLEDLKRIPPTAETKAEISRRCLEGAYQEVVEKNRGIPGHAVPISEYDCRRIVQNDKRNVVVQSNSLMTEKQQDFFKRFDMQYDHDKLPDFHEAHVQIVNKLYEVGCVSIDDVAYLKQDHIPTMNFDKLYSVKNDEKALAEIGKCVATACKDDRMLANQYAIDVAKPIAGIRNIKTMAIDELKLYQDSQGRICTLNPVTVARSVADKLIASDFCYKDFPKGEGKNSPENLDKEFIRVLNTVLPVNPSSKGVPVENIVKAAREAFEKKQDKENTIDKNRGNNKDGQDGLK